MGNRAVITTQHDYQRNGLGIYLQWNGGRDSVEAFLKYCELKGYRTPTSDNYGWARLCQIIANFMGGTTSIGIDTISNLDCNNWDNGVYIIDGWEIVRRDYHTWGEQNEYDLLEMLKAIDEAQPENEQIGHELIEGIMKGEQNVNVGDRVAIYDNIYGNWKMYNVVGIGTDRFINGTNVNGIPYTDKYSEDNINSYLTSNTKYARV